MPDSRRARPNDSSPSHRSGGRSESVPPPAPPERDDASPVGQDDHLIGAERLPRKGDDEYEE